MAIVNITNDSFSDGGLYVEFHSAVEHACLCIEQGAQVLDLGAQSTRPGSSDIGAEIEIKRLMNDYIDDEFPIENDFYDE